MSCHKSIFYLSTLAAVVHLAAGIPLATAANPAENPGAVSVADTAQQVYRFDIPSQPLASALMLFASQSGVEFYSPGVSLDGLHSNGLTGNLDLESAVARLLNGTGLSYQYQQRSPSGRVTIRLMPAADTADGSIQLAPIEIAGVTPEGSSDWSYQQPRSVSVISREQMDRTHVRHVADLLEETAGVYSAVNQRDPGLSVNIRGIQDFGRVNMNIDGMRQNYNKNGHQARNGTMYIDSELLRSIEIEKGPRSGMGGAGVLGGIASFRTIEAADIVRDGNPYGVRLRAGHGLFGAGNGTHFNGSVTAAALQDRWSALVSVAQRRFGDYQAGQRGTGNLGDEIGGRFFDERMFDRWIKSDVGYSATNSRSMLGKLRFDIDEASSLGISYISNKNTSYDGYWQEFTSAGEVVYASYGKNNVTSDSFSIDYEFNPDSDLVHLSSKLYRVLTTNRQRNEAGYYPAHQARYETETLGWQLENRSILTVGSQSEWSLNYGLDVFNDDFSPKIGLQGESLISALPYVEGSTPEGKRTLGSLFFNQEYAHGDWLNLSAGIRYDRLHLRGNTGMTVRAYEDYASVSTPRHLLFDVDRSEGQLSPTFGIAIKPGLDSVQLFANYGKGWRPPAVTETFMTGRPHGGGRERLYPNPFLKSETSRTWEIGANFLKSGLLRGGDQFSAKIAYFDNKIDDFSYMNIGVALPYASLAGNGQAAFVNNLNATRFRGVEYQINYESDLLYANLAYTHMIGSNEFCSKNFYMGGAVKRGAYREIPNPLMPWFSQKVYEWVDDPDANAATTCNNIMGNASYMPADRGSLLLGKRFMKDRLDMGVRVRYSEGNSRDFSERDRSMWEQALWPSYTVYDAFAMLQLDEHVRLTLIAENITDQAYIVAMGDLNNTSLARGRTLSGSLEVSF